MRIEDVPFLPTRVIVDTYERDLIHRNLVEMGVGHKDKLPLPFGDYWTRRRDGGLVSIEHKYTDLAGDWPRHLHSQLTKARDGGAGELVLLVEGVLDTDPLTGRLTIGNELRGVYYDQVWSTILGWQRADSFNLRVYQCPQGSIHVARAVRAIQRHYRRM